MELYQAGHTKMPPQVLGPQTDPVIVVLHIVEKSALLILSESYALCKQYWDHRIPDELHAAQRVTIVMGIGITLSLSGTSAIWLSNIME